MTRAILSKVHCPLCQGRNLRIISGPNAREFFDCSECRLISLAPRHRLSEEDEKARYELHQNDPSEQGYRNFLRKAIDPLLAKTTPHAKGLDYGCGPTAAASVLIGEAGYAIENYDPHFFPRGDLHRVSFDFILCTETCEHFFFPDREFEQLNHLLLPEGWLAVMTKIYCDESPLAEWWYARDPSHVALYRKDTFEWIARKYRWIMEIPCQDVRLFNKPNT